MKKYLWLADLMAQTVFSVCFTLLSIGGVLTLLGTIWLAARKNKSRRERRLLFGPKKSLGLERFSLRRHK